MNPGDEPNTNSNPDTPDAPGASDAHGNEFSELDAQADRGELTEEALQAKLNAYAEAYRQEYELAIKAAPDNAEEYTRDFFKKNVHSAAAQVVWLSSNAISESVRLNASKTVIAEALADARADGDPIKELLGQLTTLPTTN